MSGTLTFPLLSLYLSPHTMPGFASLLQHGFLVPMGQPVPMMELLLALPGFSAQYLEKTVQTIFINGVAADTLDQELAAGTTLALSAAMPGLAGAIFRRQGIHGSLRSRPVAKATKTQPNAGYLRVKLFNSIATERVADLLHEGILVDGPSFHDFARRREELFAPPTRWQFEKREPEWPALLQAVNAIPVLRIQAHDTQGA